MVVGGGGIEFPIVKALTPPLFFALSHLSLICLDFHTRKSFTISYEYISSFSKFDITSILLLFLLLLYSFQLIRHQPRIYSHKHRTAITTTLYHCSKLIIVFSFSFLPGLVYYFGLETFITK